MSTQPPGWAIDAARLTQKRWSIPASVQLAQFALESAWGTRTSGPHNYFGMKALTGQPQVIIPTHEVYKGVRVLVQQSFRAFASDLEAFDAHGKLLATAGAYAKARAKLSDPFAFAAALTGIYATDPNYGASIAAVIRGSNLTAYDHG